ncbi:nucleoside hydrolase [Microbacteriaceae bacterium 4G12]
MRKIPIIIDTDPGIDDAAALGMAFHRVEFDAKLITTVHGNVRHNDLIFSVRTANPPFNVIVPKD